MLFGSKKALPAEIDSPNTVIGSGITIEAARLTGRDSVRIDGEFKGNIELQGSLVLGEGGSITGEVRSSYFLVAGEVNGNIYCDTQLHFAATARVVGDVNTPNLILDEGSQVTGRYNVGEVTQPATYVENPPEDDILEDRLRFLEGV
ncbi:MAG: polymer-forming cytoskeletal protein [Defluviitaleaceae bacterium]|nr:polymer-forming cytoskeletal protein [Defluviitaleaceae bacterium]MCL2238997.1 polymer-forming cytoskeletal protein [Defluviitaleaceae bacterium]